MRPLISLSQRNFSNNTRDMKEDKRGGSCGWESMDLGHPPKPKTLAIYPKIKGGISDLLINLGICILAFSLLLYLLCFLEHILLDPNPLVLEVLPNVLNIVYLLFVGLTLGFVQKWLTIKLPKRKTIAIDPNNKGIISDLLKFVRGRNREEKPLLDFDCTNNRAYQSGLLVSNSEKTNAREPSEGVCMTEGVLSLVDSTTRISSTDFDAPGNSAHLVRANQSGPIMLNSEKKDTREGLIGECLTESVLSFDDSTKRKWFPVFDATEIKAHLVSTYQSGPVLSLSENQNRGEASKRECITKSILGLEDLQQHCGGRPDAAAKSFRGFHTPDSVARKSFEVLETLPARKQPNDGVPLLLPGRSTLEGCVQQEKSPDLPRVMQFNGVEQRVTKMPRYLGGLTAQSASSSCVPIGLPDGGHIVLLDALDQSTKNIEHVATVDQCSPTLSLPEKKMVRKTLNRNCRTMSVIFEEKHQRFVRRCEGATKSLGAMCISRKHGINQVSMVEPIHKQRGIHQWPFLRSAVGLPDGGHILFLLEKKIVRKTLKRKRRSMSVLSLEDHKQHGDRRWEDAAKSHGAKCIRMQLVIHRLSTAKCTHKKHGIHQWPFQRSAISLPDRGHILSLSEKKIVRKTLKRKCRSMSVLSLVDRQQHVDRRWEDAVKNIGAKRICRQLVIHCVSIAKRIYRQHGIYHRWPFQHDLATMKGYSLGDERPVEVISLSTHVKLVSRLQLIYISWLGRFSPQPSALAGGGEIGGPIALSLSESAATKNIAQHVGQDQSGSAASDSENERTREQGDPEEINATITLHDIRRHYGRRNREDAAASLAISVSTFKRKCREYGIKRWPHVRKRKVGRPPDQHGEGNTSTAHETPLHYVQTGMEGELVGQNEVANVFQIDFMGGPIALNTESGLIMVSRPPDQHGERNTSTACRTPSRNVETGMEVEPVGQNQEANVFHGDFMYGPIALNTDGLTFPECSDAVAPSQLMSTILDTIPHLTGSSSECAFQVKNQSTQFTANPYPNGLVDPHPQIALTQILSENMERLEDRRNLLAPQKEPLPEGHVFGSVNWTVRSCSDVALSQPMPTIPHTTGCSEYWRNSLALLEEHLLEENDYGSINLTAPSCFDPGPSQPMHTIPHTMPTIPQMMPLLTERQDMRSVRLKATYGNTTIKFPLPSGFSELKEEVSKRLEFERGSFKLEYKDEEGDSVLIACDDDVRDYLRLLTSLGNQVIKLFVLDKVPNTTNFCDNCGCDNCRSLKCKRP